MKVEEAKREIEWCLKDATREDMIAIIVEFAFRAGSIGLFDYDDAGDLRKAGVITPKDIVRMMADEAEVTVNK